MTSKQPLILVSAASVRNGSGHALSRRGSKASSSSVKSTSAPKPLTDELVAEILKGRGLRGWFRAGRVAGVMGLFTLYLFLDTYDVRASFNRRMASQLSEDTPQSLAARLNKLYRHFVSFSLDKLIRLVRLIVFRGGGGSEQEKTRLATEYMWLHTKVHC